MCNVARSGTVDEVSQNKLGVVKTEQSRAHTSIR